MREIKFRVYSNELGVIVYNEKNSKYHFDILFDSEGKGFASIYEGCHELYEFDAQIMQYTGLKDKNGKEIYEGDIIKREFEISKEIYDPDKLGFVELENTIEGYFIGVVNFRLSEGWVLNKCTKYNVEGEVIKKRSGVKIYKNYSEVIGNIYDNPELLKGE